MSKEKENKKANNSNAKKSLPTRSKQHISRKKSLEILSASLPEHWIVRSFDEADDYGIDCEIELVQSNLLVPGEFVKAQVKGREKITFKNKKTSVGGIKQSTIRYWLGLSKKINVFLIITDNKNEKSYFTNIFWQATVLLDGSRKTKSFEIDQLLCLNSYEGKYVFIAYSLFQNPMKQIEAHKWFIKKLHSQIFEFFGFVQYDKWSINYDKEDFSELMLNIRNLKEYNLGDDAEIYYERYWENKSEEEWNDSIMNVVMVEAYSKIMPFVCNKLADLRLKILAGKTYWNEMDSDYYDSVESFLIPEKFELDYLQKWIQDNKIVDKRYW